MIQVMDLLILDIQSFRYEKREIVASLLYLQLGFSFGVFTNEQVWQIADIQDLLVEME